MRGLGDVRSLTGTISFNQCCGVAGHGRKHFRRLLIAEDYTVSFRTLSALGTEAKTNSFFYHWASWNFEQKNLDILKRIFKLNSFFLISYYFFDSEFRGNTL